MSDRLVYRVTLISPATGNTIVHDGLEHWEFSRLTERLEQRGIDFTAKHYYIPADNSDKAQEI